VKAGKVLPYVVLSKLEEEGFVESYSRERRRYYRITERGRQAAGGGGELPPGARGQARLLP